MHHQKMKTVALESLIVCIFKLLQVNVSNNMNLIMHIYLVLLAMARLIFKIKITVMIQFLPINYEYLSILPNISFRQSEKDNKICTNSDKIDLPPITSIINGGI